MTAEMVRWSERKMGGMEVEREGAKNGKSGERKDGRKKGRKGEEEGRGRGYEMVK